MRNDEKQGVRRIYPLRGTIEPGQTRTLSLDFDGSVTFDCRELRGTFTTLQTVNGDIVDYGKNTLRFKIIEGGTSYQFMNNYCGADILLSPGRKKSPLATNNDTAPGTVPVYQPFPFHHRFTKRVEVEVINEGDTSQEIDIVFIGYESKLFREV